MPRHQVKWIGAKIMGKRDFNYRPLNALLVSAIHPEVHSSFFSWQTDVHMMRVKEMELAILVIGKSEMAII